MNEEKSLALLKEKSVSRSGKWIQLFEFKGLEMQAKDCMMWELCLTFLGHFSLFAHFGMRVDIACCVPVLISLQNNL